MPLTILKTDTRGRQRPQGMGRSLHVAVHTTTGADGLPTVNVVSNAGLSATGRTYQEAMESLNREVQKAIHTPPSEGKGNL